MRFRLRGLLPAPRTDTGIGGRVTAVLRPVIVLPHRERGIADDRRIRVGHGRAHGERAAGILSGAREVVRERHRAVVAGGGAAEKPYAQPFAEAGVDQAVDRVGAACAVRHDRHGAFGDARDGGVVEAAGHGFGMVVRQVGADDDHRFGPVPQRADHVADFAGRRVAGVERDDRQIVAQHPLQEGDLHLDGVFPRMGRIVDDHGRHGEHRLPFGGDVDGDDAERRGACGGGRARHAAHGDAMRRPDDHRAADRAAPAFEQRVGERRGRPRIHVAGMRHDHRFRRAVRQAARHAPQQTARLVQLPVDHAAQRIRVGRVERAGHGRGADARAGADARRIPLWIVIVSSKPHHGNHLCLHRSPRSARTRSRRSAVAARGRLR